MIPYVICPCQGVQQKSFWRLVEGGRAWAAGRGASSSPAVRAGLVLQAGGLGRGLGCRVQGAGCRVWRAGLGAGVLGRVLCWVAGVRGAVSCGRGRVGVWWFLGALCGAWYSLRGDGVASVVVVVWCRVVYPRNKTCNAKTSYKCAILLLACKSPCGA